MSTLTRTVLITGGTSGLGYQCALQVARERPDYQVIVASRSDSNGAAVLINKSLGQKNAVYLPLDLSSPAQIRAFVADYATKQYPPIAALVLNAAIQFYKRISYTDDGIETTFAVNHVGHALLFYLLRPHLAANARMVIVTSGVHDPAIRSGMPVAKYTTAEELAHIPAESVKNGPLRLYPSSKLCNVLWTYALHNRLLKTNTPKRRSWTVTTFCPGLMPGTGLARNSPWVLRWGFTHVLPHMIPVIRLVLPRTYKTQESGAALTRLAIGRDVDGVSGRYFEGIKEAESSVDSHVVEKQDDLWEWTIKYVAKDQDEAKSFQDV